MPIYWQSNTVNSIHLGVVSEHVAKPCLTSLHHSVKISSHLHPWIYYLFNVCRFIKNSVTKINLIISSLSYTLHQLFDKDNNRSMACVTSKCLFAVTVLILHPSCVRMEECQPWQHLMKHCLYLHDPQCAAIEGFLVYSFLDKKKCVLAKASYSKVKIFLQFSKIHC